MENLFENIFNLIKEIIFGEGVYIFYLVRYIVIVLIFVLIALHIFFLNKALKFRPIFHPHISDLIKEKKIKEIDKEKFVSRWESIKNKISFDKPESFYEVIILLDNLIDDILIELGFKGDDFLHRLEELSLLDLKSLKDLYEAHKIRMEIEHNKGFVFKEDEMKEIFKAYENFLKEMGILEI
jgi:hypothetical protein